MRDSKPRFVVSEAGGFDVKWQINPHMKPGQVDPTTALKQHSDLLRAIENCGAEATPVPFVVKAHDSVFMKDNAILLRDAHGLRAWLSNPVTPERSPEPIARASHLKNLGFEIHGQSREYMEGGDVVISPLKDFALMGFGFRTSRAAAADLEKFLGIPVTPLELIDPYFYHLDTALNCTMMGHECVVLACEDAFTHVGWHDLHEAPGVDKVIPISREEAMNFALNWVEVNDTIIIGGEAPRTRSILEDLGKSVVIRPLDQFQLAGGSAACLVAQVHDLRN